MKIKSIWNLKICDVCYEGGSNYILATFLIKPDANDLIGVLRHSCPDITREACDEIIEQVDEKIVHDAVTIETQSGERSVHLSEFPITDNRKEEK